MVFGFRPESRSSSTGFPRQTLRGLKSPLTQRAMKPLEAETLIDENVLCAFYCSLKANFR